MTPACQVSQLLSVQRQTRVLLFSIHLTPLPPNPPPKLLFYSFSLIQILKYFHFSNIFRLTYAIDFQFNVICFIWMSCAAQMNLSCAYLKKEKRDKVKVSLVQWMAISLPGVVFMMKWLWWWHLTSQHVPPSPPMGLLPRPGWTGKDGKLLKTDRWWYLTL